MTIHDLKEGWYVFEIISVEESDNNGNFTPVPVPAVRKVRVRMRCVSEPSIVIQRTFVNKNFYELYLLYLAAMNIKMSTSGDIEFEPRLILGKRINYLICLYDLKVDGTVVNHKYKTIE